MGQAAIGQILANQIPEFSVEVAVTILFCTCHSYYFCRAVLSKAYML